MADIRRDRLLVEEQAQFLDVVAKLGAVMPSEPLRIDVRTLAREMRDAILRLPDLHVCRSPPTSTSSATPATSY